MTTIGINYAPNALLSVGVRCEGSRLPGYCHQLVIVIIRLPLAARCFECRKLQIGLFLTFHNRIRAMEGN